MTDNGGLLAPQITVNHNVRRTNPDSELNLAPAAISTDVTSLSLQVPTSPTKAGSLDGETLRSRSGSFVSDADTARPRTLSDVGSVRPRFEGDELTPEEALQPDKTNEQDFEVANNPFAFSPGQLNKLLNPKSLAAYKALGGIKGLERGLRTDIVAGLSVDETSLEGEITFGEATNLTEKNKNEGGRLPREDDSATPADSASQYSDRKRVYKDNRLPAKKSLSIWKLFWNAYNDRILIILTIAAAISLALGIYEVFGQPREAGEPQGVDWVEGLAILVAVVVVVLVTGINDYRREKQFVALNAKKDDRQVKAIRSGKSAFISVYDVTVGDVLHLESGDAVPADGVLISGFGIRCDESSATGESDAKKKTSGDEVWNHIQAGTATSKLDPFIISGSKVLEGVGTYLVTSVGVNSSFGKILMSLHAENEDTPLQVKLARLANWIGYGGTGAAGLLFTVLLIRFLAGLPENHGSAAERGSEFLDIFIVAITIIVVAIPEGLPVAVTLALSFATKKLFRENNLVRHLRACETMGNATTICSDKTGTLTQNKMTVVAGSFGTDVNFAREIALDLSDEEVKVQTFHAAFGQLSSSVKDLLLQSIAINSTAFEGEEDGKSAFIGSKTETALLALAREYLGMGPLAEVRTATEVVQFIPFDSNRKCSGVVIRLASGSYRLLVKGAAEIMLANATRELVDVSDQSLETDVLTQSARTKASLNITDYAEKSLRTIGMLYRDFQQWPPAGSRTLEDDKHLAVFEDVFEDMTLLGIVGLQDPLRDGVPLAVKRCQDAGIVVRMVTGDSATTATAIATQCGIKTADGIVMEGPKFRVLSDEDLDEVLPKLQVLARSSPEDKSILVNRLKYLGQIVAVTGDGTNDAPALKAADIGFSMGIAGTEVAKEASDVILLDDNFSSIISSIMWGRSVNDAVAKFLQFQLTVNVTAVVLAFISAVSSADSQSVLTAVQLLWVNLIMDTFAALALATDAPTEKILNRKPTPRSDPLITTTMWKMIIGQSIYQLTVTFVLYFAGASILGYDTTDRIVSEQLDTIVFNTFVWMQIFNQYNNRRLDNKFNIFEGIHRNYFFMVLNVIMVGGQVMIIFFGGQAFQVRRIDSTQWAICILCALPCILWAVVLRCIPDKWAAAVFSAVGKIFFGIYRPLARLMSLIFWPIGKGWRSFSKSILAPMKRGLRRASSKVSGRKDTETITPCDEEAITLSQTQTPVSPVRNLPPITLTTAT